MKSSRNFARQAPPWNGYGRPGQGQQLRDVSAVNVQTPSQIDAARINEILDRGVDYWLQTLLNLANPAATTSIPSQTAPVDYDLVVLGAQSNIYLSTITIQDQGKDTLLTNSATAISAIAGRSTLEPGVKWWPRPYLLRARTQFLFTTTGDGTETGGFLALFCLKMLPGA